MTHNASKQTMLCLKKAREMGCYVKQTEPYSPWKNMAEGGHQRVTRRPWENYTWKTI